MTTAFNLSPNACVYDWLRRVDTQYDGKTKEQIKKADYDRAQQDWGLRSNITNNYYFSERPAYSGINIGNSSTTTYHTINVHNAPTESSKSKKAEEEKTNWKGIAVIGFVSTAVAGISLFVYARLSKAVEGAVNYLENTKKIKNWAETTRTSVLPDCNYTVVNQINQIALVQLEIDQKAVNKITHYKYSIFTSLVGTLAIAGGGITILAAAPALATAGTIAVVAGGILNSMAVMYAAYNCGMHWSDEKEGKDALYQVKRLIPDLIKAFKPNTSGQIPDYSRVQSSESPPSYDESQFVYNQRVNPNQIYPNLSGFIPSAPPK